MGAIGQSSNVVNNIFLINHEFISITVLLLLFIIIIIIIIIIYYAK